MHDWKATLADIGDQLRKQAREEAIEDWIASQMALTDDDICAVMVETNDTFGDIIAPENIGWMIVAAGAYLAAFHHPNWSSDPDSVRNLLQDALERGIRLQAEDAATFGGRGR
jgi:hypothetical protein